MFAGESSGDGAGMRENAGSEEDGRGTGAEASV